MPPSKRTGNQSTPHPEDPLGEYISHVEFRAALTTLSQLVTAQNERPAVVLANPVANSAVARIQDFPQMNPPSFIGSKLDEDPQNSSIRFRRL